MQKCEGSFVIGVWGYGLTMSFFWAYLSSCLSSLGGCRGSGDCHSMHCERGKLHHGHIAIISKGQHTDNSGLNRGDFLLWGQHWDSVTPQLIPWGISLCVLFLFVLLFCTEVCCYFHENMTTCRYLNLQLCTKQSLTYVAMLGAL